MIVQAVALALLAAAVVASVLQYFKYRKIKRIYRADYAKASFLKSIGRWLPFMPGYKSNRRRKAEALIINSGLRISVEEFYLIKTLLFVLAFVFIASVQTTNTFVLYENIINDLNMDKTLIDTPVAADREALQLEREVFKYVDASFPKNKVKLKDLNDRQNSQSYIKQIENLIRSRWNHLGEDAAAIAGRMYKKLVRIRSIESDYAAYLTALAAAVFLYFVPNIAAHVKLKLIEDKRDWEILNYIYVFSIFGRMPPYNIKNVLSNMHVISDIYKPVIAEALNGIKSGRGEKVFESLFDRVDNEELYELLEAMKLSMTTGILNIADNIDEMASNQLKWLEIKSIKRRKTKQVIAMVPVVMVMLAAVVYFSYSLSTLSNPMNFLR